MPGNDTAPLTFTLDGVPEGRRSTYRIAGRESVVSRWIRWRYNSGYTEGVKTAVSMPDELFRLAEATARRLRVSRSELYAKAIAEYLKLQQDNTITDRLNEIYSRRPAKLDSGLHRAQLKSLEKDVW